ncbi:amidase [Gluconacetobacter sacchari DSM 12717]|nr:amidase [Gluconacetobacter sacchari DSM 12717]
MTQMPPQTIHSAAQALAEGRTTSRALVEDALARIADPDGEGARTFMGVHARTARARADHMDALRKNGHAPSAFAGLPMSVKDLFDEAGAVTRAGSRVLDGAAPAVSDAPALARLNAAGMISIGRTTMTEFAFSGVGINPHYGTPANPWRRSERRVPGGSSSGAAISVTDGMAFVGIGTDTGGSCRIPAALTGLVGFKPTASRIPRTGMVPLSSTLDSVGSIARSVACCWTVDSLMAGGGARLQDAPSGMLGASPRLGVLSTYVLDGMDETVGRTWEACLSRLAAGGVSLADVACPALNDLAEANSKGGFPAPEALAWHSPLLRTRHAEYDPFVLRRILRGQEQSAVDYITLMETRARIMRRAGDCLDQYDAVIMPTVPIVAPRQDALTDDGVYAATNLKLLRNSTVVNFLDRCAITIPCHSPGEAPVGLMLMGRHHEDAALLQIAAQVERALAS